MGAFMNDPLLKILSFGELLKRKRQKIFYGVNSPEDQFQDESRIELADKNSQD